MSQSICLDDQHLRVDGETQTCPANTFCSTRLSKPRCRGGLGEACTFNCAGLCLRDGSSNVCIDDRIAEEQRGLCDNDTYNADAQTRIVCSERCEDLIGCVVRPGQACFSGERCIDPVTLDTLDFCPDSGVCPAESSTSR